MFVQIAASRQILQALVRGMEKDQELDDLPNFKR